MNAYRSIVCIGTSTGGPGALERVLSKLPAGFPAPLFIVQHMPRKFTQSLAVRLNSLAEISVKEAEDGERAKPGTAYIAPGGFHMKIVKSPSGATIHLEPPVAGDRHCPSVNKLFESAVKLRDYEKIAVIMTGMGSDGADGLRLLKESGRTFAIAESKDSAIVFGMPRAAADAGVDEVLHVDDIAEKLVERFPDK